MNLEHHKVVALQGNINTTIQALYVFLMKHYELFLDPAIRGGQGMLV